MMLEGDGASSITFSVLEAGLPWVTVRKPPGLKIRKGGPVAGLIHGISALHL